MMNKALVITGGSRGIGKATCQLFQDQDFKVINISRSSIELPNAIQFFIDLTNPNSIMQQKDLLLSELEGIEQIVLVHCAASHTKDSLEAVEHQKFTESLAINIISPSILSQVLVPIMPAGSSIIYLGSTLSEKAVSNAFSYTTAKHGVIGMMRATCQDLAGKGIHTVCVCPGFTDTEMFRHHIENNPNTLFAVTQKVTFKRLIAPKEIAETIHFCATNPVVNGTVFHANLGQIES
ncbi:short-chain dehydrogenase [Shewanella sp. OPT22]|nr:short-chain dehydrogenase [Shewanella sp. OPT22]